MERTILMLLCLHLGASCILAQNSGFVSLAGRDFILNGQPFYPQVMNFSVLVFDFPSVRNPDPMAIKKSVNIEYDSSVLYAGGSYVDVETQNAAALEQQLSDHFAKVRSMGFNTVRLGLPMHMAMDAEGVRHYAMMSNYRLIDLDPETFEDIYSVRHFQLIREMIQLAAAQDLKVILLCGEDAKPGPDWTAITPATEPSDAEVYRRYLARLAQELINEPGLMAYDLWNEPVFSGTWYTLTDLSKATVCEYTTMWYDAIRSTGSTHLITLGGSSLTELGSWDPAIMKLDFYSPHIYPLFSRIDGYDVQAAMERMLAKVHWQSRACPIPWLIGEMGFSAEDDHADPKDLHTNSANPRLVADPATHRMPYMMGSEAEQASFLESSMDFVRANRGSGYSWWGFQNSRHASLLLPQDFDPNDDDDQQEGLVRAYHFNFWGPLKYGNPAGLNLPAPWNVRNRWRDKAMVATMQNYTLPPAPAEMPPPPSNYYNWYNLNTDVWREGYVKDQYDQPVADALIEVPWRYVMNSFSPPAMPAWTFEEWMPYVTDQNGFYSIRKAPDVIGFHTPIEPTMTARTVNAAGAVGAPMGGNGGTTFLQRELLPYSSEVQVLVDENEVRMYEGRVQLDVTSGTVEGGANGGRADLFATHSVHVSAPFHAEAGSETHIYTTDVFADCPGEGSGMIPEPNEPSSSHGIPKRRLADVQLRFERPVGEVRAYPSPTSDMITLQCSAADFSYRIFDSNGSLVFEGQSLSEYASLDVAKLAPGVYRCSISVASRTSQTSFTVAR